MSFAAILALIELGLNITLSALKSSGVTGTDYSGLATSLETALAPLLGLIGAPAGTNTGYIVLAALGTFIGVLGTLKQDPKMPADMIAKLDEYMLAAQKATSAYVQAGKTGYDPSALAQVAPIV